MQTNRAIFLDRDGTIIHDRGYARYAEHVKLIPGVAQALRTLLDEGFLLIVVTNQSGLGRGLVTADQYAAVNARMCQLLEADGVRLTAIYHCPHVPEMVCACRKPNRLLFERAAAKYNVALEHSAMVGDRDTDMIPGIASLRVAINNTWTAHEVRSLLLPTDRRVAYPSTEGPHAAPV